MNRTVAYQETSNNYTDLRQQIKGSQISTIKNFGVAPPAGGGDFPGQFGLSADAAGESLLYTYGVGGVWQLVGKSGDAGNLPDTVVYEDRANNFTDINQRIEDCPITFMDSGTRLPANVAIKGPGHFYCYESTPPQFYISLDGATLTQLRTGDDAPTGVEVDKPNDFVDANQTILGNAIANVMKSSMSPEALGMAPRREGELYIQLAEGTADRKARLWIANLDKWEPLTHIFDLPNTVAQTSKVNNFEPTEQTIAGKQIMTFIDGGDSAPQGVAPDYEGQFYIATKTNQVGFKDVAIWVAKGNAWLPIQEDVIQNTIARTDKSNRFAVAEQILGEGGPNARHLIGARHKFSGHAPNVDTHWKVQNLGEITIYENSSVVPREFSVWVGISKNPDPLSNLNEWSMVWSSKGASLDHVAKTNESNEFAPFQYITGGQRKGMISTGYEGKSVDPQNRIIPFAPGDTFTQSFSHPSLGETRNLWMAACEGDTASWKRLLTEGDGTVAMVDRANNFQTKDNFIGLNTDTKRTRIMGARVNHVAGPVYNGVAPSMFGEVVVCEEWDPTAPSDPSKIMVRAYLAVGTSRKSWLKIGERLKDELEMIDDGTNN